MPAIGCEPGSYGWSVLHERHPALIARVRAGLPFGPAEHEALSQLECEVTVGVVTTPEDLGPADQWRTWARDYVGRPLDQASFLWAENYFYRRLLDATGYYRPGPWHGIDPFRPMKLAELASETFRADLDWYEGLAGAPPERQDAALLSAALWGNRADLGFQLLAPASGGDGGADVPALLADESGAMWSILAAAESPGLLVVTDNTARELVPDLLLADHLLAADRVAEVSLHVKPAPYFVSDATASDLTDCVRWLTAQSGRLGEAGRRLWSAAAAGRLVIWTHPFYCAPLHYYDMPDDLVARFGGATLTIMKGDLNYRRLVGDRHWPATTPFADLTAYFPGPVTALRTVKSELAAGLDAATVTSLDRSGRPWRIIGEYAVIHTRP